MGRPRLVLVLLAILLAAGCLRSGAPGSEVEPAADDGAPPAPDPDRAAPASPSSAPGTTPPARSAAGSPTPSAPGASPAAAPPAAWPAGPGTELMTRIEAAIAAGEPVTLPVMPVQEMAGLDVSFGEPVERSLVLVPSRLMEAAPWAERDGVRIPFPALAAYEGYVEGEEDQLVRLTVTPQWARGSVRIGDDEHVIRVNMDANFPRSPGGALTMRASSFPLASQARPAIEGASYQEEDCLRPVPPFVQPMTDPGRSAAAPLTARIVLESDRQLTEALGDDAAAMMVAMLHEMDSIYDHEIGVRYTLVGVHLTTTDYYPEMGATSATGSAEYDPFPALAQRWNARADVERDVVHLFTGQPTGFAQANCIGGAGDAAIAYAFTPVPWEREYPTFHTRAFAHEFGHLFSAHHQYGNPIEGPLATIMLQGYTPGAKPVFGSLEKAVIRGWAEENL